MNPVIGKITCPISTVLGEPHEADVCQEATKHKRYYYRCLCGVIQPKLEAGQRCIQKLLKPLTGEQLNASVEEVKAAAVEVTAAGAKKVERDTAPPAKKKSWLDEEV